MYLVLIETSSNQNFIFSTNKLRENIGASELTYQSGTQWVMAAVALANGQPPSAQETYRSSTTFRERLLDAEFNAPIDHDRPKVEIIIATSGKALLLAKEQKIAQEIIQAVTKRALIEAPGLDICGVIEEFDWEKEPISAVNQRIHQRFAEVHSSKPGPDERFLRLPVVADCSTSGLPAANAEQGAIRSTVSIAKRNARDQGFDRIQTLLTQRSPHLKFLGNAAGFEDEFEAEISWLAVVHADGNGLGQIFLDFGKDYSNRDYVDKYRRFSLQIDVCTENAFLDAVQEVFENDPQRKSDNIPLVPLILGGDDLTVLCDGSKALKFTQKFLTRFEELTQENEIILEQTKKHLGSDRLSACAGISVIKNHFPFSIAYHLAEQLIKSAKKVKEIVKNNKGQSIPCSAIDYHILYDSSSVDLNAIRSKLWRKESKSRLYGRPYVVSPKDWYKDSIATAATAWLDQHHWSELEKRVKAINEKDDEGRYQLPNSQMHDLREALSLGQKRADARYQLIRHRYEKQGIRKLEGDPEHQSLFWKEKDGEINVTGFLDAMDAAGFWQGGKADE